MIKYEYNYSSDANNLCVHIIYSLH